MPALWQSLAAALKSDHGIILDPVTEVGMATWWDAHPNPPGEWSCWLNGCVVDGNSFAGDPAYADEPRFQTVGMQSLLATIRRTGATQPVVLGGLDYNADLSQLLTHLPSDPQHQLIASTHVYDFAQGSGIDATFTNTLEPIAKQLPVILGELGEQHCDSGTASYTQHVLSLIDGEAVKGNLFGVLPWTWNAGGGWQCPTGPYGEGGPLLIRNYTGTPTVMGSVYRNWVLSQTP